MMKIDNDALNRAVKLLQEGNLVAIPTETVYGLAADASNPKAIQKIYTAKGRPSHNPLIIHLPNRAAMSSYAINIPNTAWQLAEAFWPGPLTLILQKHPNVPSIVTANQDTVALRVPNHPITLELLRRFKGGLAAPSANRSGRISPTQAEHVQEELGSHVDFILDGGPCQVGIESTIVLVTDSNVTILRQGAITATLLARYVKVQETHHSKTIVPGNDLSHYAPSKPLYLLKKEALLDRVKHNSNQPSFSVLSFMEKPELLHHSAECLKWRVATKDPLSFAQNLYANLRALDQPPSECILIEMPPTEEAWLAIMDRLTRAAVK